jgi:predicted enzyme related to lactoylglutathione lyase
MPEISRHQPGTFSWPELSTTNQKAAVGFYRALFGWDVNEQPMGPGETYSIFQLRGLDVAAAYTMRPQEQGAPPHWNAYLTVDDADRAAARAQELGARVFAPPFDVFDLGRMAVLQDPTGAAFQVWQPRRNIGVRVLNEPGALCWTELTTTDPAAAEAFYTGLFGWKAKHAAPGSPFPYTEFTVAGTDTPSIGMMQKPPHLPPEVPSFWLPYFQDSDVDATAAKATSLGGQIHHGPQDIPDAGRFVVLADPQGAAFAVFSPKVQ